MTSCASFVGRRKELGELRRAYVASHNLLIVGFAGSGKTALLRYAQNQLRLLVCEDSSSLGRICESLERHFGWAHRNMNVIERKNRLLPYLARRAEPVALDSVALTPPRVARFIHNLIERIPVWIACRSVQSKDIGSVWQHLHHFARIDLGPLSPNETATIIRSAVSGGRIPASTANHIGQLHRLAGGNPRALEELLIELSSREYRLENTFDRRLLQLDRRIHNAAAIAAVP
jgi:DNA-binding NarL/FixJ family response regulator